MPLLRPTCLAALATLLVSACSTPPGARPEAPANSWAVDVPTIERPEGETAAWWFRAGAAQAAERGAMAGNARNVILFVGDGMSLTTVTAARIHQGQRSGASGEENRLAWEDFPSTAFAKTYNTDMQTPDSAGTMTAMATGVKTRAGVVNIGPGPLKGDCAGALRSPLLSLWEIAADAGMATGVVSTARLTHATPAATFTRAANRGWEDDSQLSAQARDGGCSDIASQFAELPPGRAPAVLLGGGREHFMPVARQDPEYPGSKTGARRDGRDLTAEWQQRNPQGTFVWNAAQLAAAPIDAPVLGLFEPGHMQFEHDRDRDAGGEPSLADMTREAIRRLQAADNGYVLMVEAGRIDHAHHYGNAIRALDDTVALSDAVQAAIDATSDSDTLVLVTADHAHTLTFAGYPRRGNPILGKVEHAGADGKTALARDGLGLPYTTLGYANGPGYRGFNREQPPEAITFYSRKEGFEPRKGRPDLTDEDTGHTYFQQEATVPMADETHGGDDVGIWARGPGSHAVRGTVEQNAVFHFMLQATPRLRAALCERDLCNAQGVPVELPDPADFAAP